MGEILIPLQSLVKERENEETLVASVGHHNTTPQLHDFNRTSFRHPQGEMVPRIMYPIDCTQSPITNPEILNHEKYLSVLMNG